ncbi:hypothetical protein NDU88_001852 [Pleurodeles waltl]|uniref:Uncharacterized protein n=1 Tax=Pleurodeles waltl TaxID=8319 RepID=A0AAV7P7U8_PLEWA|nr:hypothetical protein NDU88_001852 [Pleurodeles waltl]
MPAGVAVSGEQRPGPSTVERELRATSTVAAMHDVFRIGTSKVGVRRDRERTRPSQFLAELSPNVARIGVSLPNKGFVVQLA